MNDSDYDIILVNMDLLKDIRHHITENSIYRIVFVGDSITSAEWVHPNWREIIEYVLKEELTKQIADWKVPSWNIRCINSGLDGSTTKDWAEKVDQYIKSYDPHLVIIMLGGNDRYNNISADESYQNFKTILSQIEPHTKVIISTDPKTLNEGFNKGIQKYKEKIEELTSENIAVVPMYEEFAKFHLEKFYTFINNTGNEHLNIKPGEIDTAHPNQLGNAYIAKVLLKYIFRIEFNPEKYIEDTKNGVMYPQY